MAGNDVIPAEAPDFSLIKTGHFGCPIPPVSADELQILEMRGLLISLKNMVDAETVLRMHGATLEDLKVLAAVEEGLTERRKNILR